MLQDLVSPEDSVQSEEGPEKLIFHRKLPMQKIFRNKKSSLPCELILNYNLRKEISFPITKVLFCISKLVYILKSRTMCIKDKLKSSAYII